MICLLLTVTACAVLSSSRNPLVTSTQCWEILRKAYPSAKRQSQCFYKLQIIFIQELALSLLHHFTRPASTRFSASYLTLRCLNYSKGTIIRMFISEQWKSMIFSKSNDGVFVENQIIDKGFGENIIHCLKPFTEEYNRG